jgi:hypothetical protein
MLPSSPLLPLLTSSPPPVHSLSPPPAFRSAISLRPWRLGGSISFLSLPLRPRSPLPPQKNLNYFSDYMETRPLSAPTGIDKTPILWHNLFIRSAPRITLIPHSTTIPQRPNSNPNSNAKPRSPTIAISASPSRCNPSWCPWRLGVRRLFSPPYLSLSLFVIRSSDHYHLFRILIVLPPFSIFTL